MPDNYSNKNSNLENNYRNRTTGKWHARYILYAFVIAVFFAPILTRHSVMDAAKMFLIELMFLCGLLSLFVFVMRRRLFLKLHTLEENTDQLRDEVVIQFTQGRASLNELNEKLAARPKGKTEGVAGLLKTAYPVLMLVLNKEKSMMRWGLFGLKVAKNIFDLYRRSKNK